jgi:DNA-directed RNA polymerase subunit omega
MASALTNPLTTRCAARKITIRLFVAMVAPLVLSPALVSDSPTILQFPTEAFRPVRSLRNMTTQLLQEAAQVIPNQQLLINVVSKRVRQLGLGHRPMVDAGPRASLTDIALKEIIAGKLTYESLQDPSNGA